MLKALLAFVAIIHTTRGQREASDHETGTPSGPPSWGPNDRCPTAVTRDAWRALDGADHPLLL